MNKLWLRHYWKKIQRRLRGVRDSFSVATAATAAFYPLANDQGGQLRITHISSVPIVVDEAIDLGNYTVTVAADNEITVASVASYVGPVRFTYKFTDGRSMGLGEVVGEFTA